MLNERRYVTFIPQEDNLNDKIQAEDINELQRTLEDVQEEQFKQADSIFLEKCMGILQNHTTANAMIVDLLEDISKIDSSSMVNVRYDENIHSIVLDQAGALTGKVRTRMIFNETEKPMRNVILVVDEYKPEGTAITYEFSYDGIVYHPITPGSSAPLSISQARGQFILRVNFKRDTEEAVPRLDAWTVLYEDESYNFAFLDSGIEYNHTGKSSYTFEQSEAAEIWEINHGLNKIPNIIVLDENGDQSYGDVEYIDMYNVRITFSRAIAGTAYLT